MNAQPERGPILFMGEQEDPDLDNAVGRGFPRIYDASAPVPETLEREVREWEARPAPAGYSPWLWQWGRLVRCGCGNCFTGPCPRALP